MKDKNLSKQTITLGTSENPIVSLMLGHVDEKTFAKAFALEGWVTDEDDRFEIKHTFGVSTKTKRGYSWRYNVDKNEEGAQPITISLW